MLQKLKPAERSDLNEVRNEYLFRTPFLSDMLLPLLKDKRDEPMLHLMLNIAEFVIPSVTLNYAVNFAAFPAWVRHLCGVTHVVMMLVLFLELDASSTEKFQRDSWAHFFRYWLRFVWGVWLELPMYCVQTKRVEWGVKLVSGLGTYLVLVVLLAKYVNFTATFYIFMLPYVVGMTGLAFGNWSQHIFVNPQDSMSNFGLTYNCIDNAANKRSFNDGYHAIHHTNARLHWSELPKYFIENQDKHIAGGAVTFRGLDFFEVGVYTMTKQLDKLARYYVHLGPEDTKPTLQEIEAKLKSWLVPIEREAKKAQ